MTIVSGQNREPETTETSLMKPTGSTLGVRGVSHILKFVQWTRFVAALIVGITFGLGSVRLAAAQNVPSGTIELSGGTVAAGIGYTWGSGTLIYEGRKYPLKLDGFSILHVGVSGYTASGTVYDLNQLSDINGIYTAVSAGVAIAGGASVT